MTLHRAKMRIFIFLCITAVVSAQEAGYDGRNLNFGPDTPYQIVPIAHKQHDESPDHRIIQLTSFDREMRFYLEPTDGYLAGVDTPVFTAKNKRGEINNVQYKRIPNAISGKYKTYQDPVNKGAFVVQHDKNGFPLINGIIDLVHTKEKLIIQPILSGVHKLFGRRKRHTNDDPRLSNRTLQYPDLEYTHHHVVYKVPSKELNDYEDSDDDYSYEIDQTDLDSHEHTHGDEAHGHIDLVAFSRGKKKRWQGNNKVPEIVYPQVLIIIESSYFKLFNRDVDKLLQYVLAFWNGVDLRYRAYQKPEIRLNIAGIIIAEDSTMTPYISNNNVHIRSFQNNKINVTQALRDKAAFLYPETFHNTTDKTLTMKRLNLKYDFAFTMTTLDMCQLPPNCANEKTREYTCDVYDVKRNCDTLGYAYYTGACAIDLEYKEIEAVGIIEDTGSFIGIVPTAHEMGHLLGASHEKDNEHGCDWNDGYLMSFQLTATEDSFIFSNCSAESVKKFLQKESRAQCMFDKPSTGSHNVPRKLPGKLYSRDQICDRAIGTRSCKAAWHSKQCSRLYCEPPRANKKSVCESVPNHVVPEGSSCGDGFYCINGKCISEKDDHVHLVLATTTEKSNSEEDFLSDEQTFH